MRKTAIAFLILTQIGCGSETPFKRGANPFAGVPPLGPLSENPPPGPKEPPDPRPDPKPNPNDQPISEPIVAVELNQPYFNSKVRGLIEESCTMCHDNPAPDYVTAVTKVVFGKPDESPLYLAGSGKFLPSGWKHKNIWRNNPDNLEVLKAWIMGETLLQP